MTPDREAMRERPRLYQFERIETALASAMCGEWGREDALRCLAEIESRLAALLASEQELEGALRSTQDTLLHKVPRTQAVKEQLESNRLALRALSGSPTGGAE